MIVWVKTDGSQDRANSFFSTHLWRLSVLLQHPQMLENIHPMRRKELVRKDTCPLRGMIYGDNVAQGFVRNHTFIIPIWGFHFSVPSGYETINQPEQFIAKGRWWGASWLWIWPKGAAGLILRFIWCGIGYRAKPFGGATWIHFYQRNACCDFGSGQDIQ